MVSIAQSVMQGFDAYLPLQQWAVILLVISITLSNTKKNSAFSEF